VPLTQVGASADGFFYLNVIRRSALSPDQPMWSPSFGEFRDPSGLRPLKLDPAITIPAGLPTAAEFAQLDTQGLVARWRLDDGTGTMVRASAGETAGTLSSGAAWDNDAGRSVARLSDSRRQFVDFGSAPAFDLTGPLTLLVWARYEPTDTWYPALLGKGYEATGTYGMHVRPGGTIWFEIDGVDNVRHIHNPTDLCLIPGQWCHVAATYDGQIMRVFVNGREASSGKPVATTIRTNTEPLRFGWLGSYGCFNGCVRDISVYNRALSPAEVFMQYVKGK
jgi:hypothetical protein